MAWEHRILSLNGNMLNTIQLYKSLTTHDLKPFSGERCYIIG
jgi:hypothetical protein